MKAGDTIEKSPEIQCGITFRIVRASRAVSMELGELIRLKHLNIDLLTAKI